MSVVAEVCCPNCQKRYVAGGSLAGKRVKCRACGDVFDVPGSSAPIAAPQATEPDFSGVLDDSNFPTDFDKADEGQPFRPNTKHKFPTAATLDRWLAPALIGIGVLWALYSTLTDQRVGSAWVTLLRFPAILALYYFVVVPLALQALGRAARSLRFELPPEPKLRMAATGAIPAALGYSLWTAYGSSGAMMAGWMVAVILTSPAFWVLFRPRGEEIVPSYAATCGGFLGGTVASGLALLLVAALLNASMDAFHVAGRLQANPLGPSFAWNVTPFTKPGDTAPVSAPLANPVAVVVEPAPAPQPAAATQTSIFTETTTALPQFAPPPASPVQPTTPDLLMTAFADQRLPFAAAVHVGLTLGTDDYVVSTATASPWCAIIHRDSQREGAEDVITAWNLPGQTAGLTVNLPHFSLQGRNVYALSPDGLLVARAVQFPKAAVQIWSLKESRMLRTIESAWEYTEAPRLIGFNSPDTLVICGKRASDEVVEVRNALDGASLRSFWVYAHVHSPDNCVISPDGKALAIAARVERRAELVLYNLEQTAKPRILATDSLDPKWEVAPAGIAFSPDHATVTALFERDGNASFFSWKLSDGVALPDRVSPGAWPLTKMIKGRALDFIGPDSWLMGGDALVEVNSGRLLSRADLNISTQWLSDPNTLNIEYSDAMNVWHLATLQLRQGVANRQ